MIILNTVIFRLVNDNWNVKFLNSPVEQALTMDQFVSLIKEFQKRELNDAYFNKKSLNDLIILSDDLKVIIKDYETVKNRQEMNELSKKVNKLLLKRITQKVKNTLNNTKVKITSISLAAILISCNLAYEHSDKNEKESSSQVTISTIDIEDSSESKNSSTTSEDKANTKENNIMQYFDKYCKIFKISDDIKNKLYEDNVNKFKIGDTIESEIADIIYSYYETNLYEKNEIEYNNYTNEEQEDAIIKYALINGVSDTDTICTMLAVHRLESQWGNSEYCRNYNNLGGIYGTNPNNNEYEIKKYPNLDVAAIDFVRVFIRIKKQCQELPTYSEQNTLEYNMNPIYCTEKMNPDDPEWYEVVAELKAEIKSEYKNQEENSVEYIGDGKHI